MEGSTAYNIVFVLHILTVVVGFGGVMLNGVYGLEAKKRGGSDAVAIGEANLAATHIAYYAIYAIPVTGILLVLLDDRWGFEQLWISLSFLLYFAAVAVGHAVMMKGAKRILELGRELAAAGRPAGGGRPPQVAEIEAIGKRLGAFSGVLSLAVVAIIALMIFKPGA